MNLFQSLNFVKGSFARRDFVPGLQHVNIQDGFVYGFNGEISLGAPIACKFNACPLAAPLLQFIALAQGEIELAMTNSRLKAKAGNMTAFFECFENEFPVSRRERTAQAKKMPCEVLPVLRKVHPFIGQDASRPWACGVHVKKRLITATNNILLVQSSLAKAFPFEVVLPFALVQELLRINEEPEHVELDASGNNVTFFYSGGRWLSGGLFENNWPNITAILDSAPTENSVDVPPTFFLELAKLLKLCGESREIFIDQTGFSTVREVHTGERGVHVECATTLEKMVCFNVDCLYNLSEKISQFDLNRHPEVCPFQGDNFRGVLIGMYL